MTGLPQGVTVEIEFTAGVWTDVTTYVDGPAGVNVRAGRTTEFDDVQASALTLTLRDTEGRFMPDSSASPYYPNVVEGKRLRVTVTQASTDYPFFNGVIVAWQPAFKTSRQEITEVTISAQDDLSLLALHTFADRWTEEANALARAAASWADVFHLAGDATTVHFDNLGTDAGSGLGTASLVAATTGAGSVSYAAPDTLTLTTGLTFTPASEVGPVLTVTPQASPKAIRFWLKVPTGTLPASNSGIIHLRAAGVTVASLRLTNPGSVCTLRLYDSAVSLVGTLVTGIADDKWRLVEITQDVTTATSTVFTVGAATFTMTSTDLRTVDNIVVAALVDDGTSTTVSTCAVAGLVIGGDRTVTPAQAIAEPGHTAAHTATFTALQSYCPEVTSWATAGGEVRTIGEPVWAGQTALAVLQTIARTINGLTFCTGDGTVTLYAADACRQALPAATVDVDQDLDAESAVPTMRRSSDSTPSRVKVDYAGGSTTIVSSTERVRREITLTTCAADAASAVLAGTYLITAANGIRVSQVAVDLTTSITDLWAVMLALYPTQRLGTSGWSTQVIPETTMDVFVQGWTAKIVHESVVYTFDCSPAQQFTSGIWDGGDTYGRWAAGGTMTVTSGTAVGTTSNGTLVITTSSGPTLSTSAGDYPLYLNWNGEKVQVTSAPAGAGSPQTVTTTLRGVAPTAATVHAANEDIDVYHPAEWGF